MEDMHKYLTYYEMLFISHGTHTTTTTDMLGCACVEAAGEAVDP